jgi:hypothetical protein
VQQEHPGAGWFCQGVRVMQRLAGKFREIYRDQNFPESDVRSVNCGRVRFRLVRFRGDDVASGGGMISVS